MSSWFFSFILSLILGIFIRSFWQVSWITFLFLSFISGILILIDYFLNKKLIKIWPIFILIAFISLGVLRTDKALNSKDELKDFRDTEKSILIEGIIKGESDIRENQIKYTVLAQPYKENILVSVYPDIILKSGDKISIKGELKTPIEFPDFNYRDYLLKDHIKTVSYYPEIKIIEKDNFNFLNILLKAKAKLRESNKKSLPFPESELLGAMILGDKQLLPQYLKDSFSKTGLSHITAISGMHITIIALILDIILKRKNKLNRHQTFYLTTFLLIIYILLVGAPTSAIRARIMTIILLLSKKIKRQYFSIRALVLAGGVMLLWNPTLLRFDIGFQLSFLAVLGIVFLSPFLILWLNKLIKKDSFSSFKSIVAMTLAAQLATLPILIYNFGTFSASAPITNILIVPILPFIIGFGFAGIIFGLLSQTLGMIFSFPVYLLLKFVIGISSFFEKFKLSNIKIETFSPSFIILYYLALIFIIFYLKKKKIGYLKLEIKN